MKIILDNIIFSLQKSGGGSVYWTELIKRFSKMNENTVFFDQKSPNDNIFRKTIDLKNVRMESKWFLSIRRYLPFMEKIKGKFIFHSSYYRYSSSPNAINVTTIHDFTTEKFRKGLAREVNLYQKKMAVKKSQGVICISENTKRDLMHFMPDTDEHKIRVIYNGVSNDFFYIDKDFKIAEKEPRFVNLENQKYLLYIGHRTGYKNFKFAVEAASKFIGTFKLVVIGEPFTAEEKIFVASKLGSSCVQISQLANEQLNYLYNKAYALLYPSSYEGFGIPIIEAMKTKCPVIAFNNSSIPEVAGQCGLIYDDENYLSLVDGIEQLKNKALRERLIDEGILQAEKFNWDTTAKNYLEFYKELYDSKI